MAETVLMPKLGFDMAEGTLVRWVKAVGDSVNKGEVLAEIETDKATVEVESSFSGVVLSHLVDEKAIVPVATPIAVIGQPGEKAESTPAPQAAPSRPEAAAAIPAVAPAAPAAPEFVLSGPLRASPLAKRIASQARLDLNLLKGSGPGGRIVRKDVEAFLAIPGVPAPAVMPPVPEPAPQPAPGPKPAPQPAAIPLPAFATGEIPADERIPLSKLRTAIGRRMTEAKQQLPHFYITHEYDAEAVMALRKQVNELLPDDQKLSVNDFLVKAVALALRQFPNLNASLGANEIIRHGHVNIGVAVAVESGLLTIVCRDADRKPVRAISAEVKDLAVRARSGKVRPDDIEGSTFSISNLGMFDVEHFVAIINPPEAAILAVGSVKQVPVVVGNELRIGTRLRATISADHRITDGAETARFMQAIAGYLEKPLSLLV